MEFERCKNLEVFFCGTVQLFAHFISCYWGMSLTSVDFLMCLGITITSALAESYKTTESQLYPTANFHQRA